MCLYFLEYILSLYTFHDRKAWQYLSLSPGGATNEKWNKMKYSWSESDEDIKILFEKTPIFYFRLKEDDSD